MWSQHEYEARSKRSALYAESIAREPGKEIEYIDFASYLTASVDNPVTALITSALRSTVLDMRLLSLGSVNHPESASLYLLPRSLDPRGRCVQIVAPKMPFQIDKSRTEAVHNPDDIRIRQNVAMSDFYSETTAAANASAASLLLFYTICDPGKGYKSLLELQHYSYPAPRDAYVGKYFLVSRGKQYEPPDFASAPANYTQTLYNTPRAIQHYVMRLDMPKCGLESLEKLRSLVGTNWQALVSRQLFYFMRYHLTSLAIPLILARQAEEKEKHLTREVLIHIIRHGLKNWLPNAQSYAEGGERLLLNGESPETVIQTLRQCSDLCNIGRLNMLGLEHYGTYERNISPEELRRIVEDLAKLRNLVQLTTAELPTNVRLPGRVVFVVAELVSNAVRVQQEEGCTTPIEIRVFGRRWKAHIHQGH